jgi:hypothetical protein
MFVIVATMTCKNASVSSLKNLRNAEHIFMKFGTGMFHTKYIYMLVKIGKHSQALYTCLHVTLIGWEICTHRIPIQPHSHLCSPWEIFFEDIIIIIILELFHYTPWRRLSGEVV